MQGLTVWTDPRWRANFEAWVAHALTEAGETVVGALEEVHLRPWSVVLRAETDRGVRFAKAGAGSQRFEPALLAHLLRFDDTLLPGLIARDEAQGWSITADGGRRARDIEDRDEVLAILTTVLPRFARLQRAAADSVPQMLALGVPDARPSTLVGSLEALLAAPERLTGGDEALTDAERLELVALLPAFDEAVRAVEAGPIPASVDHGDLHDANVYVDGGGRVLDWGDAAVAHPFMSLLVVDVALENRFELMPDSDEVRRVHRAYLAPWSEIAAIDELEPLADRVLRLGGAQKALGWLRMLELMPSDEVTEWRDAPSNWLRELLGTLRGDPPRT